MNPVSEAYVKLVLAVGQHDPDYVDAYYGPPEWRPAPARSRSHSLAFVTPPRACWKTCPTNRHRARRWTGLRREYLARQIEAVDARLRMLAGERFTFDEESRALYDAVAPTTTKPYFARTLVGAR